MAVLAEILDVYDRLGFCIIPVRPHDKAPAVEGGWAPYQQRRSTPDEWRRWWPGEGLGDLNLGVVTGSVSNIVVLDCDDHDTYNAVITAWPALGETMTIRTGKGYHVYLRPDRPTKSTSFKLNGKLHHVSSDGRQVVAPPSIHPTGRQYQFANGADPLVDVDMAEVGRMILDIGGEPATPVLKERPLNWAEEVFEGTFGIGERNERLTQLGGLLRAYFPESRWGLAYAILKDWNEKHCHPPLPEAEVRAAAFSLTRYEPRDRRS
jgi:hypothetical protein